MPPPKNPALKAQATSIAASGRTFLWFASLDYSYFFSNELHERLGAYLTTWLPCTGLRRRLEQVLRIMPCAGLTVVSSAPLLWTPLLDLKQIGVLGRDEGVIVQAPILQRVHFVRVKAFLG